MTLYDRVLIRSYLKAYVVVLVSLLSLYIVVDLFTNIDEFTNSRHGLARVLQRIIVYYAYRVTHIFDKLCEAIVMLAAMFTVAWMQGAATSWRRFYRRAYRPAAWFAPSS